MFIVRSELLEIVENIVFVSSSLVTVVIINFKMELLQKRKSFLIVLCINISLFIISIILEKSNLFNPKLVIAPKVSLISQLFFVPFSVGFKLIFKRELVDTFFSMDGKKFPEGIFNFFYWLFGYGGSVLLVGLRIT